MLGVLLVLNLCSSAALAAQKATVSDEEIATFIEDFLDREIRAPDIPGGAIVVKRADHTILSRGFGVRDYSTGERIDPRRDLFPTGSTSKLATWILVMQLVEEGRLDLDRDVNAYLDFRLRTPPLRPVTMRHLMTHSAGFGDRLPLVSQQTRNAPLSTKVRENQPPIIYAPGEVAAYSNYGAALAGRIVERLRGQPYETLVEQRILTPLGMRLSVARDPTLRGSSERLVKTYGARARQPSQTATTSLAPAGPITATTEDMGHLLSLFMGAPLPVLGKEASRSMLRIERPLLPGLEAGFGLGTIGGCYRRVCYFGHGGVTPSLATDLEVLPSQELGWYVAFNGRGENGAAVSLRQDLLRAVIDRFYAKSVAILARPDLSTAQEIAGQYLAARRVHDGPMRILDLGAMTLRSGPGGVLEADLEVGAVSFIPVDRDRFVEAKSGLGLAVSRDRHGRVARIASPIFNIATDYEPAPRWQRLALPGLLAAPLDLLLLAGTATVRWLIRRLPVRTRRPKPKAKLNMMSVTVAAMAALLTVSWAAYLVMCLVDPQVGGPNSPWFAGLRIASWVLLALALAAIFQAWRRPDPHRGRWADTLTWGLGPALLTLFASLAGFGFVAGL